MAAARGKKKEKKLGTFFFLHLLEKKLKRDNKKWKRADLYLRE